MSTRGASVLGLIDAVHVVLTQEVLLFLVRVHLLVFVRNALLLEGNPDPLSEGTEL